MQQGLANLEIGARETSEQSRRADSASSLTPYADQKPTTSFENPRIQTTNGSQTTGSVADYEHMKATAHRNAYLDGSHVNGNDRPQPQPHSKPSAFPRLLNPGPTIPPSDEEKEEVLGRARSLVLNSNDPEMQLAWAQDALGWIDISEGNRIRTATNRTSRPITPNSERQLRTDAISIINFLADQQHPKAVFLKGTWYEFGKFGENEDTRECLRMYRIAAEKGYARAEYRIGTQYEAMGDIPRAVKHYTRGASMGDSASNYRIGMMTLLGQHGYQQDYQKGVEQIKYAAITADENAPQGAFVWGMLLSRELPNITIPDQFLTVDIDQAKQFIEKAAYLGFAKAQQKLGEAYELCLLGCDFNPAMSLHYNALAAHQGDPSADMAISKWFLCGYEGVFAKNEELAFTYAQRSAQGGLPTAEFALGYFYEIGMYVSKDVETAKSWYRKAADHNNKDALARLQGISQQRVLNKQDHEQTALNRIRSQYGSRRGARPERFKEKAAPMPAMPEERVEMPKQIVQDSRLHGGRPTPSVPYPDERPVSAAPYPETDAVDAPRQRSSSLRPNSGPIADRPSSAFGLRPISNNFSTPQQDVNQRRPSSSSGAPAFQNGNPAPMRDQSQDGNSRIMSAGWDSQSPRTSVQAQGRGHGRSSSGQVPMNDIGARTRLQKQPPSSYGPQASMTHSQSQPAFSQVHQRPALDDPYGSKPLPPPHKSYGGLPMNPAAHLQGRDTASASYDARINLASHGGMRSSSARPDIRTSEAQRPVSQAVQQRPNDNRMDSTQSLPPRMPTATPGSSSVSSVTSAATIPAPKPVKAGPATFEEMGIPLSKQDSECVRYNNRSD